MLNTWQSNDANVGFDEGNKLANTIQTLRIDSRIFIVIPTPVLINNNVNTRGIYAEPRN